MSTGIIITLAALPVIALLWLFLVLYMTSLWIAFKEEFFK